MDRYHRQTLLPQIAAQGQARLGKGRALLVGCGALGTVIAEQLVRAGVGELRIVDRDLIELTNLQRQVLFDEQDVRDQTPKAIAAATRLRRINSSISIVPIVADLHAGNVEELAGLGSDVAWAARPCLPPDSGDAPIAQDINELPNNNPAPVDLILDGTDNVETRYLLNDVSVKHGIPWIYGACVGTTGRAMAIIPPATACLRCLFPSPSGAGELATCDTAGVFSPVAAVVASLQSAAAIKILAGKPEAVGQQLFVLDLWDNHLRAIPANDAKRADCIACGQRHFEFLEHRSQSAATSLCSRTTVQVRPSGSGQIMDLDKLAAKLAGAGLVERTPYLLRCELTEPPGLKLTVFPDGRLLVHGTSDPSRAKSVYARYIGG